MTLTENGTVWLAKAVENENPKITAKNRRGKYIFFMPQLYQSFESQVCG